MFRNMLVTDVMEVVIIWVLQHPFVKIGPSKNVPYLHPQYNSPNTPGLRLLRLMVVVVVVVPLPLPLLPPPSWLLLLIVAMVLI
jgi:hypothetical protein